MEKKQIYRTGEVRHISEVIPDVMWTLFANQCSQLANAEELGKEIIQEKQAGCRHTALKFGTENLSNPANDEVRI